MSISLRSLFNPPSNWLFIFNRCALMASNTWHVTLAMHVCVFVFYACLCMFGEWSHAQCLYICTCVVINVCGAAGIGLNIHQGWSSESSCIYKSCAPGCWHFVNDINLHFIAEEILRQAKSRVMPFTKGLSVIQECTIFTHRTSTLKLWVIMERS